MSARLAFQPKLGLLGASDAGTIGNLNASAAGLPEGTEGVLKVQVFGGTLTQIGSGCVTAEAAAAKSTAVPTPSTTPQTAATLLCPIGPDTAPMTFKVNGLPLTAAATVIGPENVADPNDLNNRDSALLGLL